MDKSSPITWIVPGVVALLAAVALGGWWWRGSGFSFSERQPGQDRGKNAVHVAPIDLAGTFSKSAGVPADLPGVWPGFRGPAMDGVSREKVRLASTWGSGGPKKLWSVDLGEGYAGAAVRAGRVYVLDYDQKQRRDVLRCLSLADGKEIWRRAYPVMVKRNHGMSRTVPAVSEKYVVTLGPKCQVLCVEALSGAFRWGIDLVREYGTTVPPWYAGQCPIIDSGRAILAPGGPTALMIAVDCATGKVLWKTPNPHGWQMSHSSIMPMTFHGKRMYVYCALGGVVGVSPEDGHILWETDAFQVKIATIPTPIPIPGDRILLVGGYNAGSTMLQLKEQGGKISATPLFKLSSDIMSSDQQTPILYRDHVYGVLQGGKLTCIDLKGKTQWTSRERFGLGPYILADGKLFLVNDTGVLTMVEATPIAYHQLAQADVLDGADAWGPPALVGGRLIVRDLTKMVCLDVR